MSLTTLRPGIRALVSMSFIVLLSGCSADRYFMVPKKDINDLGLTLEDHRQEARAHAISSEEWHSKLLSQNEDSTQRILAAISEQVEKPECPPIPKQPACKVDPGSSSAYRLNGKLVVGERERFYLVGPGHVYTARIDSGAKTSSLDARNITKFERDGRNWVRFDVPVPNSDGEFTTLEREVSRRVRILQSNGDDPDRRVVVELQFMIGDHKQQAEFTLADREHLTHTVLIGRNVLRDVMLVDVGKEFSIELPSSILEKTGDNN